MSSQALALAIEASKSLARRRLRLSQANVRSTHPSAGQDLKPGSLARPLDDFNSPPTEIGEGVVKFRAGVGGVGEQMAQPREGRVNGFDHDHRPVAILHIGTVDFGADQQTAGIGDDMAFATFDVLAGIPRVAALPRPRTGSATRPAALGGLDRLAVDHPRRGARFTADRLARLRV
jgi:hypothetical protein